MRDEYDFSSGERGKFFRGDDARLRLPVYLDEDVLTYLEARATEKGVDLGQLVNEFLRREIEVVEIVK